MKFLNFLFIGILAITLSSCGGDSPKKDGTSTPAPKSMVADEPAEVDPMDNMGVGPITSAIVLGDLDEALAATGKELYEVKCTACHKVEKKFIGPAPTGIMERRNPAWIMNMILDPEKMTKEDPIAKALLMEFNGAPMANQSLTEEEARSILEYFRTL